ncbi:universal stress protein [Streptomyces sp. NPDC097704]|uniref:universal stress protein n=1 Tax=Streptomyces sp. NPDC097704 TaxID=3157101 RepID=UPI00331687E7
MSRIVIAGVDGSAPSLAAADWAAREALLRGLPLKLLHALEDWAPLSGHDPMTGVVVAPSGVTTPEYEAERILGEVSEQLRLRHPGLEIGTEEANGRPIKVLHAAAKEAEVLALGSRRLGALSGFVVGSVSMSVLAGAERPVVLVRAGEQAEDECQAAPGGSGPQVGACRDVVLGLDLARPCDELLAYAFDAAASRGAALRVVHGWTLPSAFAYVPATLDPVHSAGPAGFDPVHSADLAARETEALADALRPWRGKFPGVRVEEQCVVGQAGDHLADASADASLVVVGQRVRRSAIGFHIGPVAHAVLHHATAPVAVVPHR